MSMLRNCCCARPDCFGCNRGYKFSRIEVSYFGPTPAWAVPQTGSGNYPVGLIKSLGGVTARDEMTYAYELPDLSPVWNSGAELLQDVNTPCIWRYSVVGNTAAYKYGREQTYGPAGIFAARIRTSTPSYLVNPHGSQDYEEDVTLLGTFANGETIPTFEALDEDYDPVSFLYLLAQLNVRQQLSIVSGNWSLSWGVSWRAVMVRYHQEIAQQSDSSYAWIADGTTNDFSLGRTVTFTKPIDCATDFRGDEVALTRPILTGGGRIRQSAVGLEYTGGVSNDPDLINDLPQSVNILPIK